MEKNTSMMWPNLGSRTAKEQNRTVFQQKFGNWRSLSSWAGHRTLSTIHLLRAAADRQAASASNPISLDWYSVVGSPRQVQFSSCAVNVKPNVKNVQSTRPIASRACACLRPSFGRYQVITYCLLTRAGTRVWTTCPESSFAAAPGRGSNSWPLDRKSDALPSRHHATLLCWEQAFSVTCFESYACHSAHPSCNKSLARIGRELNVFWRWALISTILPLLNNSY